PERSRHTHRERAAACIHQTPPAPASADSRLLLPLHSRWRHQRNRAHRRAHLSPRRTTPPRRPCASRWSTPPPLSPNRRFLQHGSSLQFVPASTSSCALVCDVTYDARRFCNIVERHRPIGENLFFLMPLARQQDDIPGFRSANRNLNRRTPVFFDDKCRAGLAHAWQGLVDDFHRIFTTRIVARHNDQIALRTGNAAHLRTLRLVAIATAAKHRDHAPTMFAHEITRQFNEIFQGIIGVRIVHNNRKARLTRSRDNFKSPRHLFQTSGRVSDLLQSQPASERRTRRREQVIDIHTTRKRRLHSNTCLRRDPIERRQSRLHPHIFRAILRAPSIIRFPSIHPGSNICSQRNMFKPWPLGIVCVHYPDSRRCCTHARK